MSIIFFASYVFPQGKEKSESQVTVISGPVGNFNNELVGQYTIESRRETVVVYVILEEFDNTKSLGHRLDSLVVNSFLVYHGKSMKFDLVTSKIGDKFLIGVERKGVNTVGVPIQIKKNEDIKSKVYVAPIFQELMRKVPIALIYADVDDNTINATLKDEKSELDPDMTLNNKNKIYNKLSHYYVIYYQLKMIGQ
ncbi:hypothetical protein FACS189455_2750 [Bacteroidia bacterium]|nr:hypothetical protein FACS189455_2750 [Bacteroidia bacterium]